LPVESGDGEIPREDKVMLIAIQGRGNFLVASWEFPDLGSTSKSDNFLVNSW
jgi:hypothetical protein